jgi:hypothetical protein
MRLERRDFLLLRAGQPAVLSCEQLFMRFLDAQMNGGTATLFAALEADLRQAQSVRLADTSWLSRADFKLELDRVLASFTAAGGRLVAVALVALSMLAGRAADAGQGRIAPKSGTAMCRALGAADFGGVGIRTRAAPAANVADNGASVYCVYSGKSAATGGIELDIFYPAGASANEVRATMETAAGELSSELAPIDIAGADEARWSASAKSGGPAFATILVRRANLVFTLGIPSRTDARAQLQKLAALVLQRM